MPIYGFTCKACGHQFDRLQKIADPDPDTCPECGEAQVSRQVSAPNFRLAGSGWYETDFKKEGDTRRNLAGDGGQSKSSGSDTNASSPAPAPASSPAPAPSPSPSASSSD